MLRLELTEKLKALNETVWDRRLNWPRIEAWLENFAADAPEEQEREQLHALFLLSHFTFFGSRAMRALLRSLFRDRIRYPLVAEIRRQLEDTRDIVKIGEEFSRELDATRFIGMGNPSESGTHLLYFFRQENNLSRDLFVSPHECLDTETATGKQIESGAIRRLVFLDDFCGSGRQALEYSRQILQKLKARAAGLSASYHVLFATDHGLKKIRSTALFDQVSSVCELDDSFKCFHESSRYFRNCPTSIDREYGKQMCTKYGKFVEPRSPLGFGGCELLLGFEHNIPNNTLPIIWSEGHGDLKWVPAFRRYRKGQNW
jgi:hypothetical protein